MMYNSCLKPILNWTWRLRRGEIMMSLGEGKRPNQFQRRIVKGEKEPQALIQLFASLIAQERLTEAEQLLNEAIKLDGNSAEGGIREDFCTNPLVNTKGALSDFGNCSKAGSSSHECTLMNRRDSSHQ